MERHPPPPPPPPMPPGGFQNQNVNGGNRPGPAPHQQPPMPNFPPQQNANPQRPQIIDDRNVPLTTQPIRLPIRQPNIVDLEPLHTALDEAACFKKLTTYAAYTIRKIIPTDRKEKSTWLKSDVQEDKLSQEDICKEIKRLNSKGKSVAEKKLALYPNQGGQVTNLLEALATQERDKNFEWTLAQLNRREAKNKNGATETVAMTIYVKRSPLKHVNAVTLLQSVERRSNHANNGQQIRDAGRTQQPVQQDRQPNNPPQQRPFPPQGQHAPQVHQMNQPQPHGYPQQQRPPMPPPHGFPPPPPPAPPAPPVPLGHRHGPIAPPHNRDQAPFVVIDRPRGNGRRQSLGRRQGSPERPRRSPRRENRPQRYDQSGSESDSTYDSDDSRDSQGSSHNNTTISNGSRRSRGDKEYRTERRTHKRTSPREHQKHYTFERHSSGRSRAHHRYSTPEVTKHVGFDREAAAYAAGKQDQAAEQYGLSMLERERRMELERQLLADEREKEILERERLLYPRLPPRHEAVGFATITERRMPLDRELPVLPDGRTPRGVASYGLEDSQRPVLPPRRYTAGPSHLDDLRTPRIIREDNPIRAHDRFEQSLLDRSGAREYHDRLGAREYMVNRHDDLFRRPSQRERIVYEDRTFMGRPQR